MPHCGCFTLGKETRYPWCKGLGGPQDRAGQVQNIFLPPGFDSWTIQPVEGCYTDNTIPAHSNVVVIYIVIRNSSSSSIGVHNKVASCTGCFNDWVKLLHWQALIYGNVFPLLNAIV